LITKRTTRNLYAWIVRLLPSARTLALWWKAFLLAPIEAQLVAGLAATVVLWLVVNWTFQVIRKPTELFFPVSDALYKKPRETWAAYGRIFRSHSTAVMTPDLLAALAQVEAAGNPVARTYWRWSFTSEPFEIYKPASSAVGMYQITDGTFEIARRLCIDDHAVVMDGPWYEWRSCWFNSWYSRVVPSHAVEMTSASLDHQVSNFLANAKVTQASLKQKQNLAIVIHLCGAGAGENYVRRGMRLLPNQRCGDHDAAGYVARVNAMRAVFTRLQNNDFRDGCTGMGPCLLSDP
jgi:hypothetical protein